MLVKTTYSVEATPTLHASCIMMNAAMTAETYPYRMKDLCERTGLSRQAIHFYVQQGLLPPGHKTGRNMAYYGEEHLRRLELIRRLQHERFLPLKAIKAILDDEGTEFDDSQKTFLREVKQFLSDGTITNSSPSHTVPVADVAEANGVDMADLRRMAEVGVVVLVQRDGTTHIPAEQVWIVEHWGRLRAAGFTAELGFVVDDLEIYEKLIAALFADEKQRVIARMAHLPAAQVAAMIEEVLPILNSFIARSHATQIRNFFSAME